MTIAIRLAASVSPGSSDGLWSLYDGDVVQTWQDLDGEWQCVDLVIDLDTLVLASEEIPALREHSWDVIGRWSDVTVDVLSGIFARLGLYRPEDDTERQLPSMISATEVDALMRRGHPWQASVGVRLGPSGLFERIAGEVVVNGRAIQVNKRPLVVLRGGELYEASIVLWGADSDTGRVAASRSTDRPHITTVKELSMTDTNQPQPADTKTRLARLSRTFGDDRRQAIAVRLMEGDEDERIVDDEVAEMRKQLATKDEKVTELEGKITELEKQLADLKPEEEQPPANANLGGGDSAPKTLLAAMKQLQVENKDLRGVQLRQAALERWPKLSPYAVQA